MWENWADLIFIQELFGHKNIKITEIYTHVSRNAMDKIISRLDGLELNDEYSGKISKRSYTLPNRKHPRPFCEI